MAFEKRQTEVRDLKTGQTLATLTSYDGPAVVIIRRLGWSRLKDASLESTKDGIAAIRAMGGAAVIKELQEIGGVEAARERVAAAKQADPMAGYDMRRLLLDGVESFDGEKSPEIVDELEHDLAAGIAREVLRRARPGLFETEEQRKND